MKLTAFALMLFVAGACATSELDVDASNGRWMDVVVENALRRIIAYVDTRHPINIEDRHIDFELVSREAHVKGRIDRLDIDRFNEIKIERLYYNILLGMLEYDVTIRGISVRIGGVELDVKLGDRRGSGTASGIFEINDIRIVGTVELKHDSTGQAQIVNISPELLVGGIHADLSIIGNDRDYSETVNDFCNFRIPELFKQYKYEINSIVGRGIKKAVELAREYFK